MIVSSFRRIVIYALILLFLQTTKNFWAATVHGFVILVLGVKVVHFFAVPSLRLKTINWLIFQ